MLFESQAKAENFIKFNGDEILEETGKAPTRSYYCELCGGFHVTSIDSEEIGKRIDKQIQKRIDKYERESQAKQEFIYIRSKLQQACVALEQAKLDDYEDLIEVCDFEIERLRKMHVNITASPNALRLTARLEKIKALRKRIDELLNLPSEEQEKFLNNNKKREARILRELLKRSRPKAED